MTITHHGNYKIPHERTILFVLIGIGLVTSGALIWTRFQQDQKEKIQQATFQLTEVCQALPNSAASAMEASKKIDEATKLFQSIPSIPGLGYRTAQAQLLSFSPCIQNVQETEDFFEAKRLSQQPMAVTGSTIHSVPEWRSLQSNLQQAIVLLKGIPKETNIYTEAQQDLQIDQTKLAEIDRRLTYEAEADHAFAVAEQLGKAASTIPVNSVNPPNEKDLLEAETQLESAIVWLKTIPEGHTVSAKAQETLALYQKQLVAIHYRKASSQLKTFVDDFYNFTTSLDATLTYHTYSEQLNQLNDRFYALKEDAPEILHHPAAQASQKALTQCNDAMSLWRYCHEGNCYTAGMANIIDFRGNLLWIPASFQIDDSSLEQAYPVPIKNNFWMQPYVQQNLALSTIWKLAKQNAATARDAI